MPRKTAKSKAQNRSRLLRANVWSIRTLWHSTLKFAFRLTLILLGLAALGAAGWGGKVALDRLFYDNPDFRLQAIQLNSNEAINERDLVTITGLDLDTNIFRIDIKEITRRLLAQPAIKDARIERQTPGTLIVQVTTRTPRAWVACPDRGLPADRRPGGFLIAFDGIVYPCPKLQFETAASLPVILIAPDPDHPIAPGKTLRHPELANCSHLINTARDQHDHGLEWIDSVKQTKPWSLTLTTREGTIATLGLREHARQLSYLHAAIAHAHKKGEKIDTINVIPRETVPYTVSTAAPPRAIPVAEPSLTPASSDRRNRDLDSLLNRN
ncbi:MAG: FtsQ-type POTRA domain-containing protein [Akkermansiaceae bacterium]|nr:FtsQ-type POTRA domain-containing protein [Akkermansiaceae bacterium]